MALNTKDFIDVNVHEDFINANVHETVNILKEYFQGCSSINEITFPDLGRKSEQKVDNKTKRIEFFKEYIGFDYSTASESKQVSEVDKEAELNILLDFLPERTINSLNDSLGSYFLISNATLKYIDFITKIIKDKKRIFDFTLGRIMFGEHWYEKDIYRKLLISSLYSSFPYQISNSSTITFIISDKLEIMCDESNFNKYISVDLKYISNRKDY